MEQTSVPIDISAAFFNSSSTSSGRIADKSQLAPFDFCPKDNNDAT